MEIIGGRLEVFKQVVKVAKNHGFFYRARIALSILASPAVTYFSNDKYLTEVLVESLSVNFTCNKQFRNITWGCIDAFTMYIFCCGVVCSMFGNLFTHW